MRTIVDIPAFCLLERVRDAAKMFTDVAVYIMSNNGSICDKNVTCSPIYLQGKSVSGTGWDPARAGGGRASLGILVRGRVAPEGAVL